MGNAGTSCIHICCGEDCCKDLFEAKRRRRTILCFGAGKQANSRKSDFVRKATRTFGSIPDNVGPSTNFCVENFNVGKHTKIELFDIAGASSDDRLLWSNYFSIQFSGLIFIINGSAAEEEVEEQVQALLNLVRNDAIIKPRTDTSSNSNNYSSSSPLRDTPLLLIITRDAAPTSLPVSSSSDNLKGSASGRFAQEIASRHRIQERLVRAVRNKIASGLLAPKQSSSSAAAGSCMQPAKSSGIGSGGSVMMTSPVKMASSLKDKISGSSGKDADEKKTVLGVANSASAEELSSMPQSRSGSPVSPVSEVVSAMQNTAAEQQQQQQQQEKAEKYESADDNDDDNDRSQLSVSNDTEKNDDVDEFSASFDGNAAVSLKSFAWSIYEVDIETGLNVETSIRWLISQILQGKAV